MATRTNSKDSIEQAQDSSLSNLTASPPDSREDSRDNSSAPSSNIAAPFSQSGLATKDIQTSVLETDVTITAQPDIRLLQDSENELFDDGNADDKVKDDNGAAGNSSTSYSPETIIQHVSNSQSSGTEDNVSAVLPSDRRSTSRESTFCSLCDDVSIPALAHCSECDADLCSACIRRHSRMNLAVHHDVKMFPPQQQFDDDSAATSAIPDTHRHRSAVYSSSLVVIDHCHKHLEERLRFFCKTCQWPVCRDCILTAHKTHVTQDIADATLAAKKEMAGTLAQLADMKTLLETYHQSFEDYKIQFEHHAQQVEEMITIFYNGIKRGIDDSYQKLIGDLQECQKTELERIRSQQLTVQNNIRDVTRLVDKQVLHMDSSIHVLSRHEMVSHALKTLSKNIQQVKPVQTEFFISKNPKLAALPAHFLGRVTLTTRTLPQAQSAQNLRGQTIIKEVMLHRELAFNICEPNTSRSSVQSVVETSSGIVWVATSQSLLKVTNGVVQKENISMPDSIASLVAGPGDKLLVSLGQGNSIKVYANGSWTPFASVPKGSMVMASRLEQQNRLQVYVAVTPQAGSTRIVSYSTEGQVYQQFKLPPHVLHGTTSTPTNASSADRASNSNSLKLTCMAVGGGGRLYLGDAGGRRLLMLDSEGELAGQYLGPDGRGGCQPCAVCMLESDQVVMADSERSTVELVSGEGKLLALLLSREHFQGSAGGPTCLTVDSRQRLWVGTSRGHVYAFTFLHTCPSSYPAHWCDTSS